MTKYSPRRIKGPWTAGYVLDLHTTSSTLIGYNEFGRPEFDTTYSEIGGLVYKLKSRQDSSAIPILVEAATSFIKGWHIDFSVIVPVPPNKTYRTIQPVLVLAGEIANYFKVPVLRSAVRKTKQIPELKNVYDAEERRALLSNAFEVKSSTVQGKQILLVDDLYRSGATMAAITELLLASAASEVYAFAFTQTRTRK
jgi:predicted amidophosphoribosyltransferase